MSDDPTTAPRDDALRAALTLPAYPRTNTYDPRWALDNLMGPNVLWLAESLTDVLSLAPGMRVLDMGCGRAISSIFLAQEFDVEVWATDFWINATDNWERIEAAGVGDRVFPIHAEAHVLPFADNFFDAAVSLDAYHYFGTADLYLSYYARFVRPGGLLGIVVPGLRHEFADEIPDHLAPQWPADYWSFHSPTWWARHWSRSGLVDDIKADLLPDGHRHWRTWLEVCAAFDYPTDDVSLALLKADNGRYLGFTRLVASKLDVD